MILKSWTTSPHTILPQEKVPIGPSGPLPKNFGIDKTVKALVSKISLQVNVAKLFMVFPLRSVAASIDTMHLSINLSESTFVGELKS